MADLATWEDIQTFTGKDMTSDTDAQQFCAMVIGLLQDELTDFLGRPLQAQTFTGDTYTLEDDQNVIFLRNTPVASVAQVVVNPDQPGYSQVVPADNYVVHTYGIEFADATYLVVFQPSADLFITVAGTKVAVDYTAGLPADQSSRLKRVIVRAAAREFLARGSDVQNVSQMRAGTMVQYTFTDGNRGGFTEEELRSVSRFKRRRVG